MDADERRDLQRDLRTTLRRFTDQFFDEAQVRVTMETEAGYDAEVWRRMCGELGLAGLAVPEEYGGAGLGLEEVALVQHELGRAVACTPYLSTCVIAIKALLLGGDSHACSDLIPELVEGRSTAAVGLGSDPLAWDNAAFEAAPSAAGWEITGTRELVIDGATADMLFVLALLPGGQDRIGLFLIDGDTRDAGRTPVFPLDQTRRLASISLEGAPARLVGTLGGAETEALLSFVATALAAEQAGGAERITQISVEYAKTRIQFGRAIGSFQAIKHRCADRLVDAQSAQSAVADAARAVDEGRHDAHLSASLAKSWCSEAFLRVAENAIQVHGGLGFTWEHPAHLYLKRARSTYVLFGSPAAHRERVASSIGV